MSEELKADFSGFISRYEALKRLYFSKLSNPQFDELGEVPSAHMSKSQIVETLEKNFRVHPPYSPTERVIRFLDGRVYDIDKKLWTEERNEP